MSIDSQNSPDDIDNPIVLRVQDISEENYYEISAIIRRRLGAIIPRAAMRQQL